MARQHCLRLGRVSLTDQPYHIITATHARNRVFANLQTARAVIAAMRRMHQDGWLHSHAWVLMPDHLHWLFTLGNRAPLSATLNRFKSGSSHLVRAAQPGLARVWQDGFFDRGVRRDDDLRAIGRYIIANPLRANLCQTVGDYPWWDAEWL